MEYRIENLDFTLRIVGKGTRVKTSEAFQTIPGLWGRASEDGFLQKLIDLSWEKPKCTLESILGIIGEKAAITEEDFTYFMGVRYDDGAPVGLEVITINHDKWAVFPNPTEVWPRLYSEWLPATGYELADCPCIECYYPPGHEPKDELWVPIVLKK
jgi:AraC family transcriptional regulator